MINVGFNVDVRLPTPELTAALAEGRAALEIIPIQPVSPNWQQGEDVPALLSVQARVVQFLPANNSPWGTGIPVTYMCEES